VCGANKVCTNGMLTLLDLRELSIDELSGRLAVSEGRGEPEQDAGAVCS
jgi:hypothetical protein